jgi:hypothetical protein
VIGLRLTVTCSAFLCCAFGIPATLPLDQIITLKAVKAGQNAEAGQTTTRWTSSASPGAQPSTATAT